MIQGSGLSRGDKRRTAALVWYRALVLIDNAILRVDLTDEKQAA